MNNVVILNSPILVGDSAGIGWQTVDLATELATSGIVLPTTTSVLILSVINGSSTELQTGLRKYSQEGFDTARLSSRCSKEIYIEVDASFRFDKLCTGNSNHYLIHLKGYITNEDNLVSWENNYSWGNTSGIFTQTIPTVPSFKTSVALLRIRNNHSSSLKFSYWNEEFDSASTRFYKLGPNRNAYFMAPVNPNGSINFNLVEDPVARQRVVVDYLCSLSSDINLKGVAHTDGTGFLDYINLPMWSNTSVFGSNADLTYFGTQSIVAGTKVDKVYDPEIQGIIINHFFDSEELSYVSQESIVDTSSTSTTTGLEFDISHNLLDCGIRTSSVSTVSTPNDSFQSICSTQNPIHFNGEIHWIITGINTTTPSGILVTYSHSSLTRGGDIIATIEWSSTVDLVDSFKFTVTETVNQTINTLIVDDSKSSVEIPIGFGNVYSIQVQGYSAGYLVEEGTLQLITPSAPNLIITGIADYEIDDVDGTVSYSIDDMYPSFHLYTSLQKMVAETWVEVDSSISEDLTSDFILEDQTIGRTNYKVVTTLSTSEGVPVNNLTTGSHINSEESFAYYENPTPSFIGLVNHSTINSLAMEIRCGGLQNYPNTFSYSLTVSGIEGTLTALGGDFAIFSNLIDSVNPYQYTDQEEELNNERIVTLKLLDGASELSSSVIGIQNRPPSLEIATIEHTIPNHYIITWVNPVDTSVYPINSIEIEGGPVGAGFVPLYTLSGGDEGTDGATSLEMVTNDYLEVGSSFDFKAKLKVIDSTGGTAVPSSDWSSTFEWEAEHSDPSPPTGLIQSLSYGTTHLTINWDMNDSLTGSNVSLYNYSSQEWLDVENCGSDYCTLYGLDYSTTYRIAVEGYNPKGSTNKEECTIQISTNVHFGINPTISPSFYYLNESGSTGPSAQAGALKIEAEVYSDLLEEASIDVGLKPGINGGTAQGPFGVDYAQVVISTVLSSFFNDVTFRGQDLELIEGTTGEYTALTVPLSSMENVDNNLPEYWEPIQNWNHYGTGITYGEVYVELDSDGSYLNPNTNYTVEITSSFIFSDQTIGVTRKHYEDDTYTYSLVPTFEVSNQEDNILRFQTTPGYNSIGTVHQIEDDYGSVSATFENIDVSYSAGGTFEVAAYNREYEFSLITFNTNNIPNTEKTTYTSCRSLAFNPGISQFVQDTVGEVEISINTVPDYIEQDDSADVRYALRLEETGASSGFLHTVNNTLTYDSTINDISTDPAYWFAGSYTSLITNISHFAAYNVSLFTLNSNDEIDSVPVLYEFNSLGPGVSGFSPVDYTDNSIKITWSNYTDDFSTVYPDLSDPNLVTYYIFSSDDENEDYTMIDSGVGSAYTIVEEDIEIMSSTYKFFKIYATYSDFTTEVIKRKFYNPPQTPISVNVDFIQSDSCTVVFTQPLGGFSLADPNFLEIATNVQYKFLFTEVNSGATLEAIRLPVLYSYNGAYNISGLSASTEYVVKVAGGVEYDDLSVIPRLEYGLYSEGVTFTTQEQGWNAIAPIVPTNISLVSSYDFENNNQRFYATWQDNSSNETQFEIYGVRHPFSHHETISNTISITNSGLTGISNTSINASLGTKINIEGASFDTNNSIFNVTGYSGTSITLSPLSSDGQFTSFIPESGATLTIQTVKLLHDVQTVDTGGTGETISTFISRTYDGSGFVNLQSTNYYKHILRTISESNVSGKELYTDVPMDSSSNGTRMNFVPFSNLEVDTVEGTSTQILLTITNNDSNISGASFPVAVYTRSGEFSNEEYLTDPNMVHNASNDSSMYISGTAGETFTFIENTGYSTGGTGLLLPGSQNNQFGAHLGFQGAPVFLHSNIAWSNDFTMPALSDITFEVVTLNTTSVDVNLSIDDFGIEFNIYKDWNGINGTKLNTVPLGPTAYEFTSYNINSSSIAFTPSTPYTFTVVPVTIERGATLYEETREMNVYTKPETPSFSITNVYNTEMVLTWDNPNQSDTIYSVSVHDEYNNYFMDFSNNGVTYIEGPFPGGTYGEWGDPSAGVTLSTILGESLIPNSEYTVKLYSYSPDYTAAGTLIEDSSYTIPYIIAPNLTIVNNLGELKVSIPANSNNPNTLYVIQNTDFSLFFNFSNEIWSPSYSSLGETDVNLNDDGIISGLLTNFEYEFVVYPIWSEDSTIINPGSTASIYTASATAINLNTIPGSTGILLEWVNNDSQDLIEEINLSSYSDYTLTGSTYSESINDPDGGTAAVHLIHTEDYPSSTDPIMYIDTPQLFPESLHDRTEFESLEFYIKQGSTGTRTRISLTTTFSGFMNNPIDQIFNIDLEWSGATLASATASQKSFAFGPPDITNFTFTNEGSDWYKIVLETEGQEDGLSQLSTDRKLSFNFNSVSDISSTTSVASGLGYTCAGGGSGSACTYGATALPSNYIMLNSTSPSGTPLTTMQDFIDQGTIKVLDDTGYVQSLTPLSYTSFTPDSTLQGSIYYYRVMLEIDPNSWDNNEGTYVPLNTTIVNTTGPSNFYIYDPKITSTSTTTTGVGGTTDFNAINVTTGASSGFVEGATYHQFDGLTGGNSYEFYVQSKNEEGATNDSAHIVNSTHAVESDPPILHQTNPGNLGIEIVDDNPSDALYAFYIVEKEDATGATFSIGEYVGSSGALNGATAVWRSKIDWNNETLPNGDLGVNVLTGEPNYIIKLYALAKTEDETPVISDTVSIHTLAFTGILDIEMGETDNSILLNGIISNSNPAYTSYSISINSQSAIATPLFPLGDETTLFISPAGGTYITGDGAAEFGSSSDFANIQLSGLHSLTVYSFNLRSKNENGDTSEPLQTKVLSHPSSFSLVSSGVDSYTINYQGSFVNLKSYYYGHTGDFMYNQSPYLYFETSRDGGTAFYSDNSGESTIESLALSTSDNLITDWDNFPDYTINLNDGLANHNIVTKMYLNSNFITMPNGVLGIDDYVGATAEIYTDAPTASIYVDGYNAVHPSIGIFNIINGPLSGFTGYTPNPLFDSNNAWCVNASDYTDISLKGSTSECYANGGLNTPDYLYLGVCTIGGATAVTTPDGCTGDYSSIYNANIPYDYFTWTEILPSGPTSEIEIRWNVESMGHTGLMFTASTLYSTNTSGTSIDTISGITGNYSNNYSAILNVPTGTTGFHVRINSSNTDASHNTVSVKGSQYAAPDRNQWSVSGFTSDESNITINTSHAVGDEEQYRLYSEFNNTFLGWSNISNSGITFTQDSIISNKEIEYSISVRNRNDWSEPFQEITSHSFYTLASEDYTIGTVNASYNNISYAFNVGSNDTGSLFIIKAEDSTGNIKWVDNIGTLGVTMESSAPTKTLNEWSSIIGSGASGIHGLNPGSYYMTYLGLVDTQGNIKTYIPVQRTDSLGNIINDSDMLSARKHYQGMLVKDSASSTVYPYNYYPYRDTQIIKYEPELFSNDFIFSSDGYISDKHQRFGNKYSLRKRTFNYTFEDIEEDILAWNIESIGILATTNQVVLTNDYHLKVPISSFYSKSNFPLLKNTPWTNSFSISSEFYSNLEPSTEYNDSIVFGSIVSFGSFVFFFNNSTINDARYYNPWNSQLGANLFYTDLDGSQLAYSDWIHIEEDGSNYILQNNFEELFNIWIYRVGAPAILLTDYTTSIDQGKLTLTFGSSAFDNLGIEDTENIRFMLYLRFSYTDTSDSAKGTCAPYFRNRNGDKGVLNLPSYGDSSTGNYVDGIVMYKNECCTEHAGGSWDEDSNIKCGVCLNNNELVSESSEADCETQGYVWKDALSQGMDDFWEGPIDQINNLYTQNNPETGYCSSDKVSLRHSLDNYDNPSNEGLFTTKQTCCEDYSSGTYEPDNQECAGGTDWSWSSVKFQWDQLNRHEVNIEDDFKVNVESIEVGEKIGAGLSTNNLIEVSGTQFNDGIYQVTGLVNSDIVDSPNDIVCVNTSENLNVTRLTQGSSIIDEAPTGEVSIKALPKYYRVNNTNGGFDFTSSNPDNDPDLFSPINAQNTWTKPYTSLINGATYSVHQLGVTFDNPNSSDTSYAIKIGKNNYIKQDADQTYFSHPLSMPVAFQSDNLVYQSDILFYQKYSDWNNGAVTLSHLNPNWAYKLYLESKTPEQSVKGIGSTFSTTEYSWNSSLLDLTLTKIGGINTSSIDSVFNVSETVGKNPKGNYYYDSDGDFYNDGDVQVIKEIHKSSTQNSDYILTAAGDSVPDEWCSGFETLDQAECFANGGFWKSINDITKLNVTALDGSIEPCILGSCNSDLINSFARNGSFWKDSVDKPGMYQFWDEQRGIRLEKYMDPSEFTISSDLKSIGLWDKISYISIRSTEDKVIIPKTIGNLFKNKPSYYLDSYSTGCFLRIDSATSIDFPDEISQCTWLIYLFIPSSFLTSSMLSIGGDKKSLIKEDIGDNAATEGGVILDINSEFYNTSLSILMHRPTRIVTGLSESVCSTDYTTLLGGGSKKQVCPSIDNKLPSCLEEDTVYGIIEKVESVFVESLPFSEDFIGDDIIIVETTRSATAAYSPTAERTQIIDMYPLAVNDYMSNFPDNPFEISIGSIGVLQGASASPGDPFWELEGSTGIVLTYGPTMFEGSFDLHIETGVTLTEARIEFTNSVNLTGADWNTSIPNFAHSSAAIQYGEDVLIQANWGTAGIAPGNYNFGTIYFTANNQGTTTSVCFNTNIHSDDTYIEHTTGAAPVLLGATFIEFGSTCEVLQSASGTSYTMGASALALISLGDINITNDPNNEEGLTGETILVEYLDHDYQVNLEYNPYSVDSVSNILENNDELIVELYNVNGSYINIQNLPNPGGTLTVTYSSHPDSMSHEVASEGHPLPLYIDKEYMPYVSPHNNSSVVYSISVATNGNTFKLYGIADELTGATVDVHYYETAQPTCNDDFIGFELDETWPIPKHTDITAALNLGGDSSLGAFMVMLNNINGWDGTVSGKSSIYYEDTYDNLQDAMDNALPLVGLPCTKGTIIGSPGMDNGSCIGEVPGMSSLFSLNYPTNFLSTRTSWRPIIFNDEGHITHLSLNFNGQMKYIPSNIVELQHLEVLNLENNGYGSTADILLYDMVNISDISQGVTFSSQSLNDIPTLTTIII